MENQGAPHDEAEHGAMSFIDHLDELRRCLLRYMVVAMLCILATYAFRKEILDLVRQPVDLPLKKYATLAAEESQKKQGLMPALGAYACSCTRLNPDLEPTQPAATGSLSIGEAAKGVGEKEKDASTDEKQNQGFSLSDVVKNTFNDFLVFFQVMLGKEPTPMEGTALHRAANAAQASADVATLPDTIQLQCQCKVGGSVESPRNSNMVFIGLPELFFAQMKVAIFAGIFLSFPYLLIELWRFVGPALYKSERKVFWIFSISSIFFFIGGALFGYFVVFPYGFDFFLSLSQPGEIMPSLSIGDYLSFSLKLLMAFGFIFELPLVVFILARLGVVTPQMMITHGRVAVVVIFILSAMLTPPDPFTMMLMAGPLLLLYILSIGVCFLGQNKKKAALVAQGIDPDEFEDS